jgi:hypothetical protein
MNRDEKATLSPGRDTFKDNRNKDGWNELFYQGRIDPG